ncbi:MAG: hypothetical protein EGS63_13270 [Lachnospira sp.]|nr:hypothetical protein [Lachnospira sp.]
MASLLLNSGENINLIKHSVKNKIFHTQDLCLRTNLRCAKDSARMEINMQKTLCHPTIILLDDREIFSILTLLLLSFPHSCLQSVLHKSHISHLTDN